MIKSKWTRRELLKTGLAASACGIGSSRVGCGVGHEILYRTVFGAANANAAAAARIVPITGLAIARLGIGHVDHIVLIDVNAAGPAELLPFGDEMPILIKDLDAVVLAIADE